MKDVIRVFLFALLFGVGAGALSLTVLSDDLHEYYTKRRALARAEIMLENLQQLNVDYDALLVRIESNPEELKRLAPVVLGTELGEPNSVIPAVGLQQRMVARQALAAQQETRNLPDIPTWLRRIRTPRRRLGLFLSGGALVLISFIWFGLVQHRRAHRLSMAAGA
ncbi:hypothetical protein ACFL6U_11225 [Planctomycetota bacterium]